jgi:hypothetical protein
VRRNRFTGFAPLVLAAAVLVPVTAGAAKVPRPTFGQILAGGGGTVPSAWAGIWQTQDTVRTCGSQEINDIPEATEDTLCTGAPIAGAPGGFDYQCSGSVTNTDIDITCTGSIPFGECTLNIQYHVVGHRSDDTSRTVETFSQTYDPPMCAFVPDDCEETTSWHVRTGAEPAKCLTPTRRSTWGGLKILYR